MYRITSKFSQQESFRLKPHSGIDFKMEIGEPIRSIKDGVVTIKDFGNVNIGKTVLVKWDDGRTAIYGHLNDFSVTNGQHVHAGDLLGHAGNTGFSTGSHLHFGLKENGHFIDPSPLYRQYTKYEHNNCTTCS
jgi:murein DD-endopeptidase MepM/ murein hydrolase activator NlpD